MNRRDFLKLTITGMAAYSVSGCHTIMDSKYGIEYQMPVGWLVCDGSKFDTVKYPELHKVLGKDTLPDARSYVRCADLDMMKTMSVSGNLIGMHVIHANGSMYPVGYIVEALFQGG